MECSGSVGRMLRLGIEGLLVGDSAPAESLGCALEQDTIHCLVLVQTRKTGNSPGMTGKC